MMEKLYARDVYGQTLVELGKKDKKVIVCDADLSAGSASVEEFYSNAVCSLQGRFDLVGPLDEDDGLRMAKIIEAQHFKLGDRIQSIGINMVNMKPAGVLVDQDKARTANLSAVFGSGAGGDALD